MNDLGLSALGKTTTYKDQYDPSLLFPIARVGKRRELGINDGEDVFFGVDIWNAYEISFLNIKGKPIVAVGEFRFPADSPNLVESKSLKLYLNSFNNSRFADLADVAQLITRDLSQAAGAQVFVRLTDVRTCQASFEVFDGTLLDDLDISCDEYTTNRDLLMVKDEVAAATLQEVLVSHLLKSNCLVTGQPDWGSVRITYRSRLPLDHASVLRYLVSFRNHNEFHEQCVERIFCDINAVCRPDFLAVEARYTRRGGLDINPCRASRGDCNFTNPRLTRQ